MEYAHTRHQVARRSRPDWEGFGRLILIKRVSQLRATYQIRLLLDSAAQTNKKLVIEVPKECRLQPSIRELRETFPTNLRIERD